MKLVLTCEHAFPEIPEKYRGLFLEEPEVLKTHEAFDPGAYDLFEALIPVADASFFQDIGRLLVESNRSTWHKKIFSRFTVGLSPKEKEEIIEAYYYPYRQKVAQAIRSYIKSGEEVLHFSVHSFTPILNGEIRKADIGFLYDPKRAGEKEFSRKMTSYIKGKLSDFRVRFNYPYLGKSDGFTTTLRREFSRNYSGIEVEINQKWVNANKMNPRIKEYLLGALEEIKKV